MQVLPEGEPLLRTVYEDGLVVVFLTALPSYPVPLQSRHPHGYRSTSGCYRYPGTSPRKPHPSTLSPPAVREGEGSRGGAIECPACRGTQLQRKG